MKIDNDTDKRANIRVIKCYGRYSGKDHGITSVRAYIDGRDAFVTRAQEKRALRRIRAYVGDSLVCADYDIYVTP